MEERAEKRATSVLVSSWRPRMGFAKGRSIESNCHLDRGRIARSFLCRDSRGTVLAANLSTSLHVSLRFRKSMGIFYGIARYNLGREPWVQIWMHISTFANRF